MNRYCHVDCPYVKFTTDNGQVGCEKDGRFQRVWVNTSCEYGTEGSYINPYKLTLKIEDTPKPQNPEPSNNTPTQPIQQPTIPDWYRTFSHFNNKINSLRSEYRLTYTTSFTNKHRSWPYRVRKFNRRTKNIRAKIYKYREHLLWLSHNYGLDYRTFDVRST